MSDSLGLHMQMTYSIIARDKNATDFVRYFRALGGSKILVFSV